MPQINLGELQIHFRLTGRIVSGIDELLGRFLVGSL